MSWSEDGNLIAFDAIYGYNEESARNTFGIFIVDPATEQIHLLGTNDFIVDQLIWSPDNQFLAARMCNRANALDCEIRAYSIDGDFTAVSSGFAENRNPMWNAN